MIEVAPSLYVGSEADVPEATRCGFSVASVCKHGPYGHATVLGYKGAAPPGDERLFAARGTHAVANVVDSPNPHPDGFRALNAITAWVLSQIWSGHKVLVHCNRGQSRGPAVALVAMRLFGMLPEGYAPAVAAFTKRYPDFAPAGGVSAWLQARL